MGATFLVLGLERHGPTALLVIGAIGFVDGTTEIVFDTVVQHEASPAHIGAVFGFAGALMSSTMIGAVALAPLANRLLGSGGAVVAASLVLVAAGAMAVAGMHRPELHGAEGVAPV
jgi:hypothetical protein